jgi:hypothetical protein
VDGIFACGDVQDLPPDLTAGTRLRSRWTPSMLCNVGMHWTDFQVDAPIWKG